MEYYWLTMLYCFHVYNKVIQLYRYWIYILFFQVFCLYRLSSNIESSPLWCTVGPCWLPTYTRVYMLIPSSWFIFPHLSFLLFGNHKFVLFFLLYLFIYFLLYNIVLVLPYFNMNPPWVYMCSQSWIPLSPPSPCHPSGSFQCFCF